MIEWLNEGLTKGQFILFVAGACIGFVMVQAFLAILRKAQENPLQDKLDAIANKVVFGKAQEK